MTIEPSFVTGIPGLLKSEASYRALFLLLTNHPGLHMPQAATSWASCLFVIFDIKSNLT
ncbi:TPA_asm: hypothetical protein G4K84_001984 [Salmonella enterica]|uniref:Uncharacterized protein n=1 Tax=Salmonella enterica TaxID=28901 RepID=A0A734YZ46_SALER|nr:hypothetical protein [Salmonella enterica]